MSNTPKKPLSVDRRFVLTATAAATGVAALSPLMASAQRKGDEPTGQTAVLNLDDNQGIDVAALNPGELVVVASAGTFYGILHRSDEQIAAAQSTDPARDPAADSARTINAQYLVIDMACPHRGCQVGYNSEAAEPFSCPCHRSRFDTSGRVLGGPARANLSVPAYEIEGTVITFTS